MLKLMYITNDVNVAMVAQKYGVDRIWIDLETLGKEERQKGLDTVKSKHTVDDVAKISKVIDKSEILVRINPMNENSSAEIDRVICAGADIIMLPMWKTVEEVKSFISVVNGRVKTTLLLETKEAVECIDSVLQLNGIDEIHIGLNDLHFSYGLKFMFELLSNGIVEDLCKKFKMKGIPFGFGGIAAIGEGILTAEKIVLEHYRMGSTRVILSRSFCNPLNETDIEEAFSKKILTLREFEKRAGDFTEERLLDNKRRIREIVDKIVEDISKNQ